MPEEKPISIGALWINTKKDGAEYLTGVINGEKVICWRNNYKKDGENSPDWRIYKGIKRDNLMATGSEKIPF